MVNFVLGRMELMPVILNISLYSIEQPVVPFKVPSAYITVLLAVSVCSNTSDAEAVGLLQQISTNNPFTPSQLYGVVNGNEFQPTTGVKEEEENTGVEAVGNSLGKVPSGSFAQVTLIEKF